VVRRRRAVLLAIEGIDGAGKSTHVAALARRLRARGFRVAVRRLYRHGVFHETACDVLRLALRRRSKRLLRVERLARVLDTVGVWFREVEPALGRHDFVILDRSLETHAAAALGRGIPASFVRSWLRSFPQADATVLLDLPARDALARIRARRRPRGPDEKAEILLRWRKHFLARARARWWTVLDARADSFANREAIARLALQFAAS
jgi:dTMP kinase